MKVGRKRVELDPLAIQALASCGCTAEEIAAKLNVATSTITTNFQNELEKGKAVGRLSLRGKQFEKAMKGDTTMLIWLGKQLLGQKDKSDVTSDDKPIIPDITDEERAERVTALLDKARARRTRQSDSQ